MHSRFIAILMASCAFCCAQQGDRKGHVMVDPIPASEIPPSPLLSLTDALKSFQLADGFVIEPIVEDSKMHMPVALSFDADNRAWVVEMTQYMIDLDGNGEELPTGKIKVFEDTTGDGKLNKVTLFLDKLVMPRAVAVTTDGVLFASSGKLQFIKRNGLKPVGEPEVIDASYAVGGNAEHQANGLLLARDNWYYSAKSDRRYRRINGKWVMQKTAFRGQWGIAQDDAGRLFHNSNSTLLVGDQYRPNLFRNISGYTPKHRISARAASNKVFPVRVTPGVNRAYQKGTLDKDGKLVNATAAAGMTIYRGENFPESFNGSGFVTEPAGNLLKVINIERGADNKVKGAFHYNGKDFLASTDEWFRPVNVYTAPDGSLWMIDMYFGLLQHKAYLTSYLRKQYASRNLDKPMPNNGRLYRIRYTKNPLNKAVKLSGKSVEELVPFLSHKNGTVRDTAQRLLVGQVQDPANLKAFTKAASSKLTGKYSKLHALWVYESTESISKNFLKHCLSSDDYELHAAALELAHLADGPIYETILAYQPKSQTALSAVYALGRLGSKEGYLRAQEVIAQFSEKVGLLAEVYVSGLGSNFKLSKDWGAPKHKNLVKQLGLADKALNKSEVVKNPVVPKADKARYEHGKKLYTGSAACMACHGMEGQGQGELFPPLAPSNWVSGDPKILAKVILHGLEGPIKVNGVSFNSAQAMPKFVQRTDLTDEDLASLMTYLRYMKGNKGGVVKADLVKNVRAETKGRTKNYTQKELMK
ncbi:MAG: c-type cytochrome [Rubritalea sp.]|uniref:DUF7133 domain-containing protein n=1 Tax=Rubritalea sp. TaxID=2109375 RepID=UPI003242AFE2